MTDVRTEPYRPSNGTEGEIFYEDWCVNCHREAAGRLCKILAATMIFDIGERGYPKEWVRDVGEWPGNPRCTAFEESRAPVHHTLIKDPRQIPMFPEATANQGD